MRRIFVALLVAIGSPLPLWANLDTARVLELPEAAATNTIAGQGRFIVCHLPKQGAISVLDLADQKLRAPVPVAKGEVLLAGTAKKVFAVVRATRTLLRFDLETLEVEGSWDLPATGSPVAFAAGHAGNGPIAVLLETTPSGNDGQPGQNTLMLLDPTRGTSITSVPRIQTQAMQFSGDGRTLVFSDLSTWRLDGQQLRKVQPALEEAAYAQSSWPNMNASVVHCGGPRTPRGLLRNPDFPWFHDSVPSTEGGFYVRMQSSFGPGKYLDWDSWRVRHTVSVHAMDGGVIKTLELRPRRLLTFEEQSEHGWKQTPATPLNPMGFHRRTVLSPRYKVLAVLPVTDAQERSNKPPKPSKKIHLLTIDCQQLMEQRDLLVTSLPPAYAWPGEQIRYTPTIHSKHGPAKIFLAVAPKGMTLTNGSLEWSVPAAAMAADVPVTLEIENDSGKSIIHAFRIHVGGLVSETQE